MLNDLFKPAWKSGTVSKRIKAIAEMDGASAEHQEIFIQLATDDEDGSVRKAALQQITSAPALHEVSVGLSDQAIRGEVEKRVNELLATNHALDEQQYRDLLKTYPELQLRLAAYADSLSVRNEAMQTLSSEQLLEVLGVTIYSDSRQLLAEKILNIEDLEAARKIMRGKDKNVERIIKAKIDAIKSHERQQAENFAHIEKLIEEVEYLVSHEWLPEFMARCRTLRQQWGSVEFEIDAESTKRYQLARDVVDARYDQQLKIEETQQSQALLVEKMEALLRETAAKGITASIEAQSETKSQQQQFKSEWQALIAITPPEKPLLELCDKILSQWHSAIQFVAKTADLVGEAVVDTTQAEDISHRTRQVQQLESALKNLKWSAEFGELQVATELRQQLADWRKAQQDSADAYQQKLDKLHKNISSISRFSRAGNLSRAKQMAARVKKGLSQFEGKDHSAAQERFAAASKTLGDMGDWKNFATEPKYIELCETMELLAVSKQHPDKRSEAMKALQQQWKALGHSDISDQYWPRFKIAADLVYQPCAEFFEQRHELRKTNLGQRVQYVEQMRELLEATDWDNSPDYKMAQSRLRSLSDSFNQIKDVERNAGQKQWKQWSKFRDAVMAKLAVAYEANMSLKQQLITQTLALAEAPARIENLNTLKLLQGRWKQIGVTPRNQDQKAWVEFKKQGDLVYSKVQALRQEQRQETDQQLKAYRDIIKHIQNLASTATDLAEADKRFAQLQADYDALPELPPQLPEKLTEGIQRDYRNACDLYDRSHSRIVTNGQNQQIELLRLKANLCAQLEALGTSPPESQLQEITQQWQSIELHNADFLRRIEARRITAQDAVDRASIGAERRLLCIQLEIVKGAESPAEDRALRMQYQLEQMNKTGLGQQPANSKKLLENMELDWLCMPGAQAQQQKELDERFQRVLRSA
jgi:exonuclease SbcC